MAGSHAYALPPGSLPLPCNMPHGIEIPVNMLMATEASGHNACKHVRGASFLGPPMALKLSAPRCISQAQASAMAFGFQGAALSRTEILWILWQKL